MSLTFRLRNFTGRYGSPGLGQGTESPHQSEETRDRGPRGRCARRPQTTVDRKPNGPREDAVTQTQTTRETGLSWTTEISFTGTGGRRRRTTEQKEETRTTVTCVDEQMPDRRVPTFHSGDVCP